MGQGVLMLVARALAALQRRGPQGLHSRLGDRAGFLQPLYMARLPYL